jgi:hypothetical protein
MQSQFPRNFDVSHFTTHSNVPTVPSLCSHSVPSCKLMTVKHVPSVLGFVRRFRYGRARQMVSIYNPLLGTLGTLGTGLAIKELSCSQSHLESPHYWEP